MATPPPNPSLHPQEAADRERAVLIRILRLAFVVVFVTVTLLTILDLEPGGKGGSIAIGGLALKIGWEIVVAVAVCLAAGIAIIDVLTSHKRINTLFGFFLGLLIALLGTYALGRVIDLLVDIYDIQKPDLVATTKILVGISLAYLCVTTVLATQDDFRLVIPYVEFAKQLRGPRPLILDTSALIDARIADLCSTGIIQYPVVIPHFVVAELQLLGDSSDKLKRGRGRRGLDIITRLQRTPGLDISIDETPIPGKAVDQMLVELARRMEAIILTADIGLNRVAGIQGVRVLNLNEVANALKPALIPGEQFSIRLLKPGEQPTQAVGYLEDGTMVVAEDGRPHIGRQVTLAVTSSLQTAAGRMIFGRVVDAGAPRAMHDAEDVLEESRTPEADAAAVQAREPAPVNTEPGVADDVAEGPPAAGDGIPSAPLQVAPPTPPRRGPFPPKPPNKRTNPFRNPRR